MVQSLVAVVSGFVRSQRTIREELKYALPYRWCPVWTCSNPASMPLCSLGTGSGR